MRTGKPTANLPLYQLAWRQTSDVQRVGVDTFRENGQPTVSVAAQTGQVKSPLAQTAPNAVKASLIHPSVSVLEALLAGLAVFSTSCIQGKTIGGIGLGVLTIAVGLGVPYLAMRAQAKRNRTFFELQDPLANGLPNELDLVTKGFTPEKWQAYVHKHLLKWQKKQVGGDVRKIAMDYGVDWDEFVNVKGSVLSAEIVRQMLEGGFELSSRVAQHIALARTMATIDTTLSKGNYAQAAKFFHGLAGVSVGFLPHSIERAVDAGYSKPFTRLISRYSYYLKTKVPHDVLALNAYLAQFYRETERSQRAKEMGDAFRAMFGQNRGAIIALHRLAMNSLRSDENIEDRIAFALHQLILSYLVENDGYLISHEPYLNAPQRHAEEAYKILNDPYVDGDEVLRSIGIGKLSSRAFSRRNTLGLGKYVDQFSKGLGRPSMEYSEPDFASFPKPAKPYK
jgi:hypothetical protein